LEQKDSTLQKEMN